MQEVKDIVIHLRDYTYTMLECKYCHRPFPSTFARTQHLRQRPSCNRKYKRELVELTARTRSWRIDDPEDMPTDMEGHRLEPVDKELDDEMDTGEGGAGGGWNDAFGGTLLFQKYLAAGAAKSRSGPIPDPVEW